MSILLSISKSYFKKKKKIETLTSPLPTSPSLIHTTINSFWTSKFTS